MTSKYPPIPVPGEELPGRPTKKNINAVLTRVLTAKGLTLWWGWETPALDGKTPTEVWPTNPVRVYDCAIRLLDTNFS